MPYSFSTPWYALVFIGAILFRFLRWVDMPPDLLERDIAIVMAAPPAVQHGAAVVAGLHASIWYLALPLCAAIPIVRRIVFGGALFFLGILLGSFMGMLYSGYGTGFTLLLHLVAGGMLLCFYYLATKLKHDTYRDA